MSKIEFLDQQVAEKLKNKSGPCYAGHPVKDVKELCPSDGSYHFKNNTNLNMINSVFHYYTTDKEILLDQVPKKSLKLIV